MEIDGISWITMSRQEIGEKAPNHQKNTLKWTHPWVPMYFQVILGALKKFPVQEEMESAKKGIKEISNHIESNIKEQIKATT